ncbi:MAG: DUF1579 domain-containing protein [Planctomycetota bacterium]|jgi:hypothetical protein
MTRRAYVGGVAALCATILVSAGLVAQEKGYEEMSPQEQAMMQAWTKYMTPGEEHTKLAAKAGEWTFAAKYWQAPGAEPGGFEGTAKIKPIMDGRFILEKVEGDFEGEEFHGLGIFGYDNLTKSYVGIWLDNMGTGIMRYEGAASGNGSDIHWMGEAPDFINGVYKKNRTIDKTIDENHTLSTFYDTTPDGQEYKHMELSYSRQK